MIDTAAKRLNEDDAKKIMGVKKWVKDISWTEALQRMSDTPTVNIEGIIGGYTGPGGKTILPHQAIAKLDLRLVPNQTAEGALAALKAHLAKHGYGDIDVNMTGGYDPTTTPPDSPIIKAEEAVYKNHGIDPVLLPRLGGLVARICFHQSSAQSGRRTFWTRPRQRRARAGRILPYRVIESEGRRFDDAVMSYVEYLYELAK